MKWKYFLVVLLVVVLQPMWAMTQDEIRSVYSSDTVALTVEQCIEIGLVYSKSLYASLMNVQAADAKARETGTKLLPSLKVEGSYTRLSKVPPFEVVIDMPPLEPMKFVIAETILNFYNLKVGLQQPLFTGFALESAVKAARQSALAARQTYYKDKNELIYNIKNAYWTLYKAQEMKKLLDENVQLIETHLADVQRFFEQGLAKNIDVLKVQVQLSNTKVGQLEAGHGVRLAMMALDSLLGLPLEKEIRLSSTVQAGKAAPAAEEAVKRALQDRFELKAMDHTLNAATAAVKFARSGYYPQVALMGNYYYSNPNQRIQPMQTKFKDSWDISVGLTFDLWNWGATSHQVAQAKAQLNQVRAGKEQLKDGIVLEVRQNYFDLLLSREKIALSESTVKQAEENYRITSERFKAGLTNNSELLDAEVALLQAKVNHTQALIDCELAGARLSKSMGHE